MKTAELAWTSALRLFITNFQDNKGMGDEWMPVWWVIRARLHVIHQRRGPSQNDWHQKTKIFFWFHRRRGSVISQPDCAHIFHCDMKNNGCLLGYEPPLSRRHRHPTKEASCPTDKLNLSDSRSLFFLCCNSKRLHSSQTQMPLEWSTSSFLMRRLIPKSVWVERFAVWFHCFCTVPVFFSVLS